MSKLKLFENTFNKLSGDRAFIAYYLNKVVVNENRTQDEMLVLLNCSLEDYYKLGLCKTPEINPDFDARINKIAEYANTSATILSNIISYSTIQQKTEEPTLIKKLQKLIPLPEWLINSQTKVYQAGISMCILLLFIFTYTPQKNETKNIQLYATDYFSYTDAIKYSQLPDNTFVFKNKL